MPAIETRALRKVYVSHKKSPGIKGALKGLFTREKTEVEAVKGIDLTIDQGELVGFLGHNGAGKTTTLKMLTGILFPTSGTASVLGYTPWDRSFAMLRSISLVMGNKMQLWWDLPAWDSFLVLKELYEVDDAKFKHRVDFLVESLQLTDKINTQVRKLSLGERMKCELVAALLHSPKILFLDEPTLGLDVVSQKRIRDFLKQLHAEDNCTILLTSHYMQDVQALCDRVVVIDQGALVYEGTLDALSREFSSVRRLRLTFDQPVDAADLANYGTIVVENPPTANEDVPESPIAEVPSPSPEPLTTAVLEIPRDKTAQVTAAVLQHFPVSDVGIEEVAIEEVVRALFVGGK